MDGNELLRPAVQQATADVRVFLGDEEIQSVRRVDITPSVRRVDLSSLALLLLGLFCGVWSYWLIEAHDLPALVLVPSVIAATTGLLNLTKLEAQR